MGFSLQTFIGFSKLVRCFRFLIILILFQPQCHFVLLLLVFSWVLITAFKKSLVKINIESLQKASGSF